MQIQISWLLKKPTDLDLHCLLRQGMSCSAREGLSMTLYLTVFEYDTIQNDGIGDSQLIVPADPIYSLPLQTE